MRPDFFARFGDLMRRGGVWKGQRLLSAAFVRKAIAPSPTNGCYGWLIWDGPESRSVTWNFFGVLGIAPATGRVYPVRPLWALDLATYEPGPAFCDAAT